MRDSYGRDLAYTGLATNIRESMPNCVIQLVRGWDVNGISNFLLLHRNHRISPN